MNEIEKFINSMVEEKVKNIRDKIDEFIKKCLIELGYKGEFKKDNIISFREQKHIIIEVFNAPTYKKIKVKAPSYNKELIIYYYLCEEYNYLCEEYK